MLLLAQLAAPTAVGCRGPRYMLGLGLGMVMQVLVLAAQNAVSYDIGLATTGSTLFRSIGGSIGVSIFGAISRTSVRGELAASLPAGARRFRRRRTRR